MCRLTATELIAAYKARRLSPVDVTAAILDRIHRLNPRLLAFYRVEHEGAMTAAYASEARWMRGAPVGPLDGVPVSIKDSIAVAGLPMYRGSKAYAPAAPSSVDAPPAARLREAGAILLGKTTMPDLGCLASGLSSQHGTARNPWNLARTPGGSTSGGAAAVAAGLGPLTIGTDLGGSVRIPAAFCGLVGLKPTQGRIPHLPASSMRSAGPLARSVADAVLLTAVLSQPDRRDCLSLPFPAPPAPPPAEPEAVIRGARIGLLLDLGAGTPAGPETRAAIEQAALLLAAQGATVEPLPALFTEDPEGAVETYFRARVLSELQHLPADLQAEAHPDVRSWCEAAKGLSAAELLEAMNGLDRLRVQVNDAFAGFDFVLSPVMPMTAYAADLAFPDRERAWSHLLFTATYNQTQQPALSVPCGFDRDGLPIGLQIVGQRFADHALLRLAAAFETLRGLRADLPVL
ncbi:amidase [Hypericibacter adhaerens]|uniref:amidase n=1 Tax=Hypericibacter adhaerens TaxID=2602016 RepID=UPI0021E646C8|nr:amidase [Hypericibacter adhaerens]